MNLWRNASQFFRRSAIRPARMAAPMIASGFIIVLVAVMMIFSTASAQPSKNLLAAPLLQDTSGGEAIFNQYCAGCHTIGKGKLVGPDLQGVTQRQDATWIKSFIADPAPMLASDPTAQQLLKEYNNLAMPNLNLTSDQVNQLYDYLSNPGGTATSGSPPAGTAPTSAAPAVPGDPSIGKLLFTGEQAFTNGGPACMGCHTVTGVASLGGGGLGPDLTHVFQRLGEAGLGGALRTIAFPTMIGPFKNRPLTATEQADLVAFLKISDQQQPPVAVITAGALNGHALLIFGIGLVIAFLLFGLLVFFWPRVEDHSTLHLPVRKIQSDRPLASSQGDVYEKVD